MTAQEMMAVFALGWGASMTSTVVVLLFLWFKELAE